jgi:hypothetical protein
MKNTLLLVASLVALAAGLTIMFTSSFGVKPDVHLWNWFGYEFGFDFSSRMPILRVCLFAAVAIAILGVNWGKKKETATKDGSEKMA